MRSYSYFSISLLCLAILLIDILAFYWLQSITILIKEKFIRYSIHLLFWIFTTGLISAIFILKFRLENIPDSKKQLWTSRLFGLTISSFLPKIIFVIVISILYFSNSYLSDNQSKIAIPLIGLFSGILPFVAIVFSIIYTRYDYQVKRIDLNLEKLPASFSGTRIIQISDLHLGSFGFKYELLRPAIDLINNLRPDYIFFTGDIVNNFSWELKGWEKILGQLKASIGKYAILGNHDYGDYSIWKSEFAKHQNLISIKSFFQKIEFDLLLNDSVNITHKDGDLAIIGVENWGNPPFPQYGNLNKAMTNVKKGALKILLTHDPTHWSEEVLEKTDIALTLSGHTHGMQMGINFKKFQWSPIQYKYKHWSGTYRHENQWLYVNRGLGWIGYPGRLGMRPEITCIDLT